MKSEIPSKKCVGICCDKLNARGKKKKRRKIEKEEKKANIIGNWNYVAMLSNLNHFYTAVVMKDRSEEFMLRSADSLNNKAKIL